MSQLINLACRALSIPPNTCFATQIMIGKQLKLLKFNIQSRGFKFMTWQARSWERMHLIFGPVKPLKKYNCPIKCRATWEFGLLVWCGQGGFLYCGLYWGLGIITPSKLRQKLSVSPWVAMLKKVSNAHPTFMKNLTSIEFFEGGNEWQAISFTSRLFIFQNYDDFKPFLVWFISSLRGNISHRSW